MQSISNMGLKKRQKANRITDAEIPDSREGAIQYLVSRKTTEMGTVDKKIKPTRPQKSN